MWLVPLLIYFGAIMRVLISKVRTSVYRFLFQMVPSSVDSPHSDLIRS